MPRHKNDQSTYRGLANYKERVQSFNMAANKLYEYTRVQTEIDVTARRNEHNIIRARIATLRSLIDRINRLV
jgi:hypothetical protein